MTGQCIDEDNICLACGILVFPAEAQLAANRKWHKRCFKCFTCNHLLSPPTCHVYKGQLFCKHCLVEATRSFSPHLYTDTTKIKPESSNEGCPRCGGAVFKAEEVIEKGRTYHKRCFTCVKCNRPQDDRLQVFVGFDQQIYCKTCYPKINHTPLPMDPRATARIKACPGAENGCKRCGGSVYEAEKMVARGGIFHQNCFNCKFCRKLLDYSSVVEYKGDIFCRTCYIDNFDHRSKSIGPGDTSIIKEANQLLNCPRCGGAVFEAEKVVSRRHFYHQKCLSCKACRRKLDASSFFDATDGEVYCRACYSQRFGNAARARSVGPIDTTRILAENDDASRCPRCTGRVFEAEKMMSKVGSFHRSCFRCYSCDHLLDQTNFNDGPRGGIFCRTCYRQIFESIIQNPMYPKALISRAAVSASDVDTEACRRCNGVVYDAERMSMRSGAYHRICFSCGACKRSLDYLLAVDGPDANDVFCRTCYNKLFGPTELRVGAGEDGRGTDTSVIKPLDPNQGCPKCKGAVYHAEMVLAKGRAYHKTCATCYTCSARLDSLSLNTGPDSNIYCKQCLDNQFGSHFGRRYSVPDVKSVKAIDNDQDRCVQCSGKVYDMERIVSPRRGLVFHKDCFVCALCKKKLDGTNSHTSQVYPYEVSANDGSTYICCKRCYSEKLESGRNFFLDHSSIKAFKSPLGVDDPEVCRKCSGKVFEAEKVVTRGGLLHQFCLTCFECSRTLGPLTFNEARDGKIYCEGCYSVKYGHRARSQSVGPIDYSRLRAEDGDSTSTKCVGCSGKIFDVEKMVTRFGPFHKPCFRCAFCNTSLESAPDSARSRKGRLCCKQCDEREKSIARESGLPEDATLLGKSFVDSNVIVADENDPDRCPRCSGKVFPAEMFSMKNGKFHRKCFSCCDCKRALDFSIACDGPMGEIFCNPCYARNFAPHVIYTKIEDKSFRTDLIKPVDKASGCPRCQGAVFEAEKLSANGVCYHKRCATCKSCNMKLDASSLFSSNDGEIYCQGCYGRKFGGVGYRGSLGNSWIDEKSTDAMRPSTFVDVSKIRVDDAESTCRKCQGKVFDLERVTSNKNGVWHRQCFSCHACRTALTSSLAYGYEAPDNQVYCKSCFVKAYGEGSKPMTFFDTKVITPGKDERGCRRCQGVVYELEKVVAGNHWFHQACFTCFTCKGKLDTLRGVVGKGGEVFCRTCYKNQLEEENRPSLSAVRIPAEPGDPNACPRCRAKVYEAEKMVSRSKWYHKECFTCRYCAHTLDQTSVMEGPNMEIYCKTCYVREYFTGGRNKFCDPVQAIKSEQVEDACKKCKGKVFEMDKVQASSSTYHKSCLECSTCKRKLDTTNLITTREGDLFCRTCYDEKFGVFGRAGSVGRLVAPSLGTSLSDRCPKCGVTVYEAEKVVTSVGNFHSSCMQCSKCSRHLDVLTCFAGTDSDLFCKNCYNEEFGVSARRKSRSRAASRPGSEERDNIDDVVDAVAKAMVGTGSIPALEGDPNKCPRCKGKVFEVEKIQSNRGIFHRNCFKCIDCQRTLDPALVYDGFQPGHIFCKKCYLERYGPSVRIEEEPREKKPSTMIIDPQRACPRCQQPVFANEELQASGKLYHKLCAKCRSCARQLDLNTVYTGKDKDIYCRGCYSKRFGLHGYGYGGFGSIPALTAGGDEVRMEYHFTQFF